MQLLMRISFLAFQSVKVILQFEKKLSRAFLPPKLYLFCVFLCLV